jgi:hypothetical protein
MGGLAHLPGWVYGLAGWLGGATSTVAGAWIASKIHVYHAHRDSHRDELRTSMLEPLLSCLREKILPLVRIAEPLVEGVATQTTYDENAHSTEPDYYNGEALAIEAPWNNFKDHVDPGLYEDARTRHFVELMRRVEDFAHSWEKYSEEVTDWVGELSHQIAEKTGLPPLTHGPLVRSYAASSHIAVFIYKRIFRIPVRPLCRQPDVGDKTSLTDEEGVTVAYAKSDKITEVVNLTNTMISEEKPRGSALLSKAHDLSSQLDAIIPAVQLAIASKKLKKRCSLVRFF